MRAAPEDPVTVERMRFQQRSLQGIPGTWQEIEAEIKGGGSADPQAPNPRFASNIKVLLSLAYQARAGKTERYVFFQSEATLVALEKNRRVKVFFYLPPEAAERDGLPAKPYAYLVELEAGGRPLPLRSNNYSPSIGDPARLFNFKDKIRSEAEKNEGVLVPIYLTPFYSPENRAQMRESPSYLRPRSG